MSHSLHAYIANRLEPQLRDRRVVVFYDPKREFEPFVDELPALTPSEGIDGLPRVYINEYPTHLARFDGSYFALKTAIEPVVSLDAPEALLVYLPGVERDRKTSVLMEAERGGTTYEPGLGSLARHVLLERFSEGQIDTMLSNASYHDVVAFLKQGGPGEGSKLKLVLGNRDGEVLIARWLADTDTDKAIDDKKARDELYKLLETRIGLQVEVTTELSRARHVVTRYVLVDEFRNDLGCEPPSGLSSVPATTRKDQRKRVRAINDELRTHHMDAYVELADQVEAELKLAEQNIDAAALGSIDTFRFEEAALLQHAAHLVAEGHYDEAMTIVGARQQSFWVDRDAARMAQWEACRRMAELGRQVERVRPELSGTPTNSTRWVEAYARVDGGWHEVDRAQRAVENWVAQMSEEPEGELERALGRVRQVHEDLLEKMARGYTAALLESQWSVSDVLHQTHIFPDCVEAAGGRVAYFLVDALRYEMGADLAEQLQDAEDVRLRPAVGVLPSITPLGMAALMPGAAASYSVVEADGKLAASVDGNVLRHLSDRQRHLSARQPDAVDINLGDVLQKRTRELSQALGEAPLIVVRSQSIDALGEMDGGLIARQLMDNIVGNVARAVRKLAMVGIEYFVIAADHGHQFGRTRGTHMQMDKPGGQSVDQHRRCWAGHGGQTTAATVRVSGAQLGYDTDLDFIFPQGVAVFRCGGDLAFHHGGASLQEMVVPALTLRIPPRAEAKPTGPKVEIVNAPPAVTNRIFIVQMHVEQTLFTDDHVPVRVAVVDDKGVEAGRAGMATGAEVNTTTGVVQLPPGKQVAVGLQLTQDDVSQIRVVVLDPETDAELARTPKLKVKLGI